MYLAPLFWTLGGAFVTFVVAAFIWVGLLVMLRDTTRKDDKKSMLTLALGSEEICSRVAACIAPCPRLNTHVSTCPVEDILKYITNGNRIILFILRKETSGEVGKLIQFVQSQVDLLYASKPIPNRQLYYSLRYAIFGIGDTAEARDDFNRLAMKIDVNLKLLGATRVVPLRLYDSTTSPVTVEEEFNEWYMDLAPEAEFSGTPVETAASGCEKDAPKGILAKKDEHYIEDEEEDDGLEHEPSSEGVAVALKKVKAPVPILRTPSPKSQQSSSTPEKEKGLDVKKDSVTPEKDATSSPSPTSKDSSDAKSTRSRPSSPGSRSSRSPSSSPEGKGSHPSSPQVTPSPNLPAGTKASPPPSPQSSSPKSSPKIKIKGSPSPKSVNRSKAKSTPSPQSSPKGHSKGKSDASSKAGEKLHGSGVLIDADESSNNSDDDWEVMEIPADESS